MRVSQASCNFEADDFFGGQGAEKKIEKHPIFEVFKGFSPITLVFLKRFTTTGRKNSCINTPHVTLRPIFFWGVRGP